MIVKATSTSAQGSGRKKRKVRAAAANAEDDVANGTASNRRRRGRYDVHTLNLLVHVSFSVIWRMAYHSQYKMEIGHFQITLAKKGGNEINWTTFSQVWVYGQNLIVNPYFGAVRLGQI